jgi:hypothetical protein
MPNASEGTPYTITLTMSPTTQAALATGGWNLYAFKGVKTSDGAAVPLVWFQVPATEILTSNVISWAEQYQAYVSDQTFVPEGAIDSSNSISISLDQTCNVDQNGNLSTTQGSTQMAISIANGSARPWTCGISQAPENQPVTPLCALPLYGNTTVEIAPIEKVLLMFATGTFVTSQVVYQSVAPGLLIDLTSENNPSVFYDINTQWDWQKAGWGTAVPTNTTLVPLLITAG